MSQDVPLNTGLPAHNGQKGVTVADDSAANKAAFDEFSERLEKARDAQPDEGATQESQGAAMGMGLKLASELLAALIVGGLLGYGADIIFDTKPLFILGGLALGMAAAFMNVLRMMRKLSKQQQALSNVSSTNYSEPQHADNETR